MRNITTEKLKKCRKIFLALILITLLAAGLVLFGGTSVLSLLGKFEESKNTLVVITFILLVIEQLFYFIRSKISKEILRRENEQTMMELNTKQPKKIKFKKINNVILEELVKNSEMYAQYDEKEDKVIIIFNLCDDNNKQYTVTKTFETESVISDIKIL